ncbi:MAG: twin-arginine translocase TatA/TatE family subunit [Pseudomonadales bacterium]|nr:twin-arginine translocase TatA/TatE family subunit [Pseudomonadales bacterium]
MSFGIPELLIILVIILLLCGTSKLKSLGSDLGSAIKGFRSAVSSDDEDKKTDQGKLSAEQDGNTQEPSMKQEEKANVHKE